MQKSKSDMVGTNNDVKALIGVSRNFQHLVQKNLNTVFRSIYNFKTDNNRQMLCAKRKRNANTITKFDKIKEILSKFDNLEPDLQIPSLSPFLEHLGSI